MTSERSNEKWVSTICYNTLDELCIKLQPLIKFNLINDYELVFHPEDDDCVSHIHLRFLVDNYVDVVTLRRAIEMIEYYSTVTFKITGFTLCNPVVWDMYVKEGAKSC